MCCCFVCDCVVLCDCIVALLCHFVVYCQEKQGNIPKIEGTSGGICVSFMYMAGRAHAVQYTFCKDTGTVKMG